MSYNCGASMLSGGAAWYLGEVEPGAAEVLVPTALARTKKWIDDLDHGQQGVASAGAAAAGQAGPGLHGRSGPGLPHMAAQPFGSPLWNAAAYALDVASSFYRTIVSFADAPPAHEVRLLAVAGT